MTQTLKNMVIPFFNSIFKRQAKTEVIAVAVKPSDLRKSEGQEPVFLIDREKMPGRGNIILYMILKAK
jgi:hypothetical protein